MSARTTAKALRRSALAALDWLTYVAVVGLIFSVSAVACVVPAWRAAQVDPVVTLRSE